MPVPNDHYAVLGVSRDSEDIVIQAAYRALMRRYHPDVNQTAESAARSQKINEAYAILSDPDRRAAYDQIRPGEHKRSASPPPPRQPPESPSGNDRPKLILDSMGTTQRALLFLGGFFGVITIVAIMATGLRQTDYQLPSQAENVGSNVPTEATARSDTTAVDAAAVGSAHSDADSSNQADVPAPVPQPLASVFQTPIQFNNIEAGANEFARILTKSGISGARAYSTRCHEAVKAQPSWQAADQCAAFDYAGAYVDGEVSRQSHWPMSQYFSFQSDNQDGNYVAAGATSYSLSSRLASIKSAVQPLAAEAVEGEIARSEAKTARQARSATHTSSVVPEGTPAKTLATENSFSENKL